MLADRPVVLRRAIGRKRGGEFGLRRPAEMEFVDAGHRYLAVIDEIAVADVLKPRRIERATGSCQGRAGLTGIVQEAFQRVARGGRTLLLGNVGASLRVGAAPAGRKGDGQDGYGEDEK